MQTVNVHAVDIQAMERLIIMTSAVPVVVRDILTTPGVKLQEADTPARVERFITNAVRVQQPKPVPIQQLHLTIRTHVVRQSIQQRGLPIVVRVVHMPGTVIIIFFVLCAAI